MNKIDEFYKLDSSIKAFSGNYVQYVSDVIQSISLDEIQGFIEVLLKARNEGSCIYFIGNGGSAATASHFVNDISIGTNSKNKPFRALSLCDNQAVITAIANDSGYKEVFSQQLEVLLKKGDVVVAISASGNSENILRAMSVAKQKHATTVGLTGFDGGKLRELADITVHVPTGDKEYGPAEDAHMVLDHLVSAYLMRFVKGQ